MLERYAAHLERLGKSYNTQYLELTTLKQIHKWLISESHIPETCRIMLKLPRDKRSTTYCWSLAEFQAIIQYCRSEKTLGWLADVCTTLGLTGMRISELRQLRWSDLDLEKGSIALVDESRSLLKREGRERRTLKNKRGRQFPINQELIPLLNRIPRHGDGFVFHGPLGGRIKADKVRRALINQVLDPLKSRFPTAQGETGFEHGRLHSFRHFFCSQCANNNLPERAVMAWLGHADAEMVRRYYHLNHDESRQMMDRMSIPIVNGGNNAAGSAVDQETDSPKTESSMKEPYDNPVP